MRPIDQVWAVDFEFKSDRGELPIPHCMVAREYFTRRLIRADAAELAEMPAPPFPVGDDSLLVAYFASAEINCFRALGWQLPRHVLDLYVEFRATLNGKPKPLLGWGLLSAMHHYGLASIAPDEKKSMRELAIRGGPFTDKEAGELIDYCQTDVDALLELLPRMADDIRLPNALLRGQYMVTVSGMESTGTPIDRPLFLRMLDKFPEVKRRLTHRVNQKYGCFVASDVTISKTVRDYAAANGYDPAQLQAALNDIYASTGESNKEFTVAVAECRKRVGLSERRLELWENSGKDHSSWPSLDVSAQQLADEFPVLGIGEGYRAEYGYDDRDTAAELWELLRDPPDYPVRKCDIRFVEQAAVRIDETGDGEYLGPLSFNNERFAEWLIREDIPWPRLEETGRLDLSDNAFKDQANSHPQVRELRELRVLLGQMRLFVDLAVGEDGRNRCLLSPFSARTGRNQPSNAAFIFGPSRWIRSLIKPAAGRAFAYLDWVSQELGIAATLSGDEQMIAAYRSGDPYTYFAKAVGAIPSDGDKKTHPQQREIYKVVSLGVLYGIGTYSIANKINKPVSVAMRLLRQHRDTFEQFWKWSNAAVDQALLRGRIDTVYGWPLQADDTSNPRALANFPMQGNGAEILRVACILAHDAGLGLVAPIHDAIAVEGPLDDIDRQVLALDGIMRRALRIVLDGFELGVESTVVRYPDRYRDERGGAIFDYILEILEEIETEEAEVEPHYQEF